ncbi:carotenoid biosynthesis protein [Micromonospora azadirachtae]|uniref:Carotenoid biosynthesis protein n=1 Tax=Micromonospora azadirachtae TaxID=1970735 RepID=A0ABW2ZYS0_9ACTN
MSDSVQLADGRDLRGTADRPARPVFVLMWLAVGVDAVANLIPLPVPGSLVTVVSLLMELTFALVHGALAYRWRGILVFLALALVISNVIEDIGVLTGVPFGHYHYTDELGPKLFEVPVLIGPAYFAVGYMAWFIATILLRPVSRSGRLSTVVGTPVVASFVMVAWDLALDPSSATLRGRWVWEDGGGYFGVPLTNFLGWSLTVYLIYQLFALYLYRWGPDAAGFQRLDTGYRTMPIVAYVVVAGDYVANWLTGGHDGVPPDVTDATGHLWRAADVYESSALTAIYGMIFLALLAALRLIGQVRGPARVVRP